VRLVVLGRGERVADLPEFKESSGEAGFDGARFVDYAAERKLIVVAEENVRGAADDPVAGESLVVSGMAKGFYRVAGLRPADPEFDKRRQKQQYELRVKRLDVEFDQRVQQAYGAAMAKGLWKGTPAARDRFEYWGAGVAAYFDAAGAGWPPEKADRPIRTRELLKAYDPDLYAIVDETMAYRGHQDWRYRPHAK
jgi:alpha-glucosidase